MSISGISSVPLYAITNTQAVLADGSVGLPSLRYTNSTSTGFYRESPNLCIAVNGVKCAEFNGGVQTFTAEVKTGMVRADNGNIALVESGNVVAPIFNGNLNATQATMANMKFTKTPTTGYVLTAQDGTGNVQWSAPSTVESTTMTGPVKSTSFVATSGLGVITLALYLAYEIRRDADRVATIAGNFEFNGTLNNATNGYVEIDINSILSGYAVQTVQGVVRPYVGYLESMSYALSIHDANTRIRITIGNNSGSPYTGGRVGFNIVALNS